MVLESVYAEIREKEQKLELGALEPREAMAQLVAFSFDYLLSIPSSCAMLAYEKLQPAAMHPARSRRQLQKMHSPFIEMLEATLERGVKSRACSALDFDAINLYISIAGISYFSSRTTTR